MSSARGEITGFKVEGKRVKRVIVFLDGEAWVELDPETLVRERLATGQRLDEAAQRRVLATDESIRARKAAANTLARSPKTRRELESNLRGRRFSAAAIEAALAALTATGTLDDERTAARLVRQRRRKADMGPRRIGAELKARGVAPELAERELDAVRDGTDFRAECAALAQKTAPRYQPLTDPKQRRKLTDWLLRRGYDSEHVREALNSLAPSDDPQ